MDYKIEFDNFAFVRKNDSRISITVGYRPFLLYHRRTFRAGREKHKAAELTGIDEMHGRHSFFHCIRLGFMGFRSTIFCPRSCPLGENTLVQRHTDRVHLIDGAIEMSFEISMCSEGFAYMARSPVFSIELDGLEVMYII